MPWIWDSQVGPSFETWPQQQRVLTPSLEIPSLCRCMKVVMQLHSLSLRSHMQDSGVSCGLKSWVKMRTCLWKVSCFMALRGTAAIKKKKKKGRDMEHLCGNKITMLSLAVPHTSCLYFHKVKIDAIRWENRVFLNSHSSGWILSKCKTWDKQDFLLLESETDLSWTSVLSLSAGFTALCWQRELLADLPVQPLFEFVILSLVFSPCYAKKRQRALQGWQLKALALASHINSIRRIAAGQRKVVEISEPFECSGCFYFLFVKLAEVR